MRYPAEIIEEVQSGNDIVEVVSSYVKIQKKGATYMGLCPFHGEKTPSFSVSSSKQMYYCFGCGAGGDVIDFIKRYENYTFVEAMKFLADRAGIKLPEADYSGEEKRAREEKALLADMNKAAALYFYNQLKETQGEPAYRYLRERGIEDRTIVRFGLGFAKKTPDDLYKYLKEQGFDDANLKSSGLVSIDEKGGRDKFWNRVIFPILDTHNKVIGFGGRVMGEGIPKYLNSPETKLFDKSRNLYGLNFAKNSRKDYILLCEGYIDVIALHQAGFTNSVASLGTAFTILHANLLKRYVKKVVLTYDSDKAGVQAALRAIPILKSARISVRILDMRPYKDPDECIKAEGGEAFEKRIENARNSFLWEIDILKKDYDMSDPEMKTDFYRAAARRLCEFEEIMERENYMQSVCREHGIPYEDMKKLVVLTGKNRYGNFTGSNTRSEISGRESDRSGFAARRKSGKKNDGEGRSKRLLLAYMVQSKDLYEKISLHIKPEDFTDELYRDIARCIAALYESASTLSPAMIFAYYNEDEEKSGQVAEIFNEEEVLGIREEDRKKAIEESIYRIKTAALDEESRNATDIGELQRIIKEQAKLKTEGISIN